MASSRRWVISSAAARPKFLVLVFFCLDFWSVPAFVDRFHWRAGIPWGHLRGEGAWKCRSGTRCVLSLSSISAQIQNLSHLFQMEVLIWVFFLCGVCFWRFGHLALTIRWFSQPSEAHAQRSVGGIVGWNPMWAILITFFLCCSLMRQRRGIIWTCFWGRFVSSA